MLHAKTVLDYRQAKVITGTGMGMSMGTTLMVMTMGRTTIMITTPTNVTNMDTHVDTIHNWKAS